MTIKILKDKALEIISKERTSFINLSPFFFGIGISIYFTLRNEPTWFAPITALAISLLLIFFRITKILGFIAALASCGFICAMLRTQSININMLNEKVKYIDINSTISSCEKTPYGMRFIISDVSMINGKESELKKIRHLKIDKILLTWRSQEAKKNSTNFQPGDKICARILLDPIYPPTFESSYDFRKQTFFNGISARGYVINTPEIIENTSLSKLEIIKNRVRNFIDKKICSNLNTQTAAIAQALITGNKHLLDKQIREVFANSGMAHILAISGLHVGIVAGFFFVIFRYIFCSFPKFALYHDIKKISAALSLLFVFIYLQISGESVPSIRAFLMHLLVVGAVLCNRTALSMRSVSIAAFAILIFYPESMLFPSFQMSFSAVIALVAFYEKSWNIDKKLMFIISLFFTSIIASIATSAFTIYTFNKLSVGGILANIVAVPIMTFIVMPLAILSILVMPFDLDCYFIKLLGISVDILIKTANTVSSFDWSSVAMPSMNLTSLTMLIIGGLMLCTLSTNIKFNGIPVILVGICIYALQKKPEIYISSFGKNIGINTGKHMCFNNVSHMRSINYGFVKSLGIEEKFNFKHKKCKNCITEISSAVYSYKDILIVDSNKNNNEKYNNKSNVIIIDSQCKSAQLVYINDDNTITIETMPQKQRPWS